MYTVLYTTGEEKIYPAKVAGIGPYNRMSAVAAATLLEYPATMSERIAAIFHAPGSQELAYIFNSRSQEEGAKQNDSNEDCSMNFDKFAQSALKIQQ